MTTYNGEKYLREQLDSILSQTISDFELVICDDNSIDSTSLILKEYKNKDNRIKLFYNEINIGFKKNFEKAITLCNGDFIALSDQDDVWTVEHLKVLTENIIGFDLIFSQSVFTNSAGESTGRLFLNEKYMHKMFSLEYQELFYAILLRNPVQGCTVLFKKEIKNTIIPINDNFEYHDWWCALVTSFFFKIKFLNKVTVYYREHDNNVSYDEKYLTKQQKKHKYYNLRYKLICSFYSSFKSKMTKTEKYYCFNLIKYYYSIIHNKNICFRLVNYIKYYNIQNLDETTKKIFLFFPRLVFQLFPKF